MKTSIVTWIDGMVASEHPTVEWLAWFWHGHFVSAITEVKNPQFMIDQINLFRTIGAGGFDELTRSITIDVAMLLYLDGAGSRGDAPNENYSRELLELFTLGHGAYTEADIAAGAAALSGWRLRRGATEPELVPGLHDDTAQQYLGRNDVRDVASVVDALMDADALAPFITRSLATAVVGPDVTDAVVARCAATFESSAWSIASLLGALVDEVANGADGGSIVAAPLLWYVGARRITGAAPDQRVALGQLRAAGQVPWLPPNVSGWPSGAAWDNAATLVARFNLSRLVATATAADHPTRTAADPTALGAALGLSTPWSDSSTDALHRLDDPVDRLTLALVSPEFVNC